MEFQEEGVCVSPSPNGLGVFSIRPFSVNELIGPVRGTAIDDPAYESDYCMELGEHSALEPESPFRFVNHSCQPNCGLRNSNQTGRRRDRRRGIVAQSTV